MKLKLISAGVVLAATLTAIVIIGPSTVIAQVVGVFTEVQSLPGDVAGTKRPFRVAGEGFAPPGDGTAYCPLPLETIAPAGEFTIEVVTVSVHIPDDEVPDIVLQVGDLTDLSSSRITFFNLSAVLEGAFRRPIPIFGPDSIQQFTATHAIRVHVSAAEGEAARVRTARNGDSRDGAVYVRCSAAGYVALGADQPPPK